MSGGKAVSGRVRARAGIPRRWQRTASVAGAKVGNPVSGNMEEREASNTGSGTAGSALTGCRESAGFSKNDMARRCVMNGRDAYLRLMVCAVVWGLTPAAQDVSAADPDDPRLYPSVPDPNDPQKTRETVSPERREQMGLTPHTWTGVVHPDVYPTLDRLDRTVAALKDKLNAKEGRDVSTLDALQRVRFPGMVYVQVQVKDRDAQRRVLASVRAKDFHAPYVFKDAGPGFLGYANSAALTELAENPDVTGICLDDQSVPGGPARIVVKESLPATAPGEESTDQPGVKEGKVDPDVYRALAKSERVHVTVALQTESLPKRDELPSGLHARHQLQEQAERELQDRVLSALSADELWVTSRVGAAVFGDINEQGLRKLAQHEDVRRVRLPALGHLPERHAGGRFTP